MKWFPLIFALAASAPSHAALRFGCGTVSIQRLDPLVEPGKTPSSHLHQIVGGNAFNATMSGDIGNQGTCTTCTFSEDFSNYWTAVMFFKHPTNGSYKRVSIMENDALPAGINGGMTIYYTQQDFYSNGNQKITAFKPGFRMTVGNPTTNSAGGTSSKGLKFVCLQSKSTRCWDGKNLDTPNHQDHMYDTQPGAFQPAGACPSSHPVRMPQVAYETLWDTAQFKSMWPSGGANPFVMSYMGKKDGLNGYGTHADYIFGWEGDSLQRAMDSNCMFQGCENGNPLKSQSVAQMNACSAKKQVAEDIDGWLTELPGMGGV
ncbi:hypothetical protein diail_2048 [Diaporthe ilicicola]|nr:hypothetical protein diail_2048 [Diaporthe ilicicola]